MTIDNLDPKCVWKNFYALTRVPRPSKKEGKVIEFMLNFGKNLGLETSRDEIGNVIIKKPATPGMENRKGVILQGHLDMVPQNNSDVEHDWEKDPVETYIDGDWVRAKGTTLGADDGLGCAIAMAVLESKDIAHGPIEALFTIDEETGMTGANFLKGGLLDGDILINLDSETEGELYVGCAGGIDTDATFRYKSEPVEKDRETYAVIVKGLRGGHSGMEINEGRGNSNKFLARLILPIVRDLNADLVSINGGNMRNSIPREGTAILSIAPEKVNKAKNIIKRTVKDILDEFTPVEPNIDIRFEKAEKAKKIIPHDVAMNIIRAIYACPFNVDRMSLEMPGMVETSNNLSIVKTGTNKVSIITLMRGASDSAKHNLRDAIRCTFELAGADVKFSGEYSGWKPNMNSDIMNTMKECYKRLYNVEPEIKAIHAGLECGILATNYPHWDMISCGPTLMSPHSPDERLSIPTVSKFWKFIVEVLKSIPVK